MKMWGVDVYLHYIDLGIRWKCVASFTPRQLYHDLKALGAHWVGLMADLESVEEKKMPSLPGNGTPAFQSVTRRYHASPGSKGIA
jgi:hypothetical protein